MRFASEGKTGVFLELVCEVRLRLLEALEMLEALEALEGLGGLFLGLDRFWLWHSMQLHFSVQLTEFSKHSQYFLRQWDLRQWQPDLWNFPFVSRWILFTKASCFLALIAEMAAFRTSSFASVFSQSWQKHRWQYLRAAKHSQYSLRHRDFLQ